MKVVKDILSDQGRLLARLRGSTLLFVPALTVWIGELGGALASPVNSFFRNHVAARTLDSRAALAPPP